MVSSFSSWYEGNDFINVFNKKLTKRKNKDKRKNHKWKMNQTNLWVCWSDSKPINSQKPINEKLPKTICAK